MQNADTQILPQDTLLTSAIKGCRKGFIAIIGFSFCINLLMLAAPLYMLQVFDRVLGGGSVETLIYLTVIVIVAFVALAGLEAVRGRMMISIGTWLERQLSDATLNQHIELAASRDGKGTTQGLRDVSTIRNFLTGPTVFPILDAPWTPVFLAVIFLLHPLLGWVATGGAILLFMLAIFNDWVAKEAMRKSAAASIDGLRNAEAAVKNADAVVAMGFAGNLIKRWAKSNNQALSEMAAASRQSGSVSAVSKFLRLALQIAMTGTGAWLVIGSELTAGGMIAASILMGRALGPVDQAIAWWKNAVAARGAYDRLQVLMAPVPGQAVEIMELPAPEGHVSVENLFYGYSDFGEPVIRNISFSLKPGERLGIAGPTAAGKSTLARLLVGLTKPQAGHVRLDGAEISQRSASELGRYIGYLPQEVELFDGTVRENIARMGSGDAVGVVQAAQAANVHDMILKMEKGYETEIGEGGAALSGGQRQRLALARALYGAPCLVVLDEPNASLDVAGDKALVEAMKGFAENDVTSVIISHRPSILRHVDKILVLHADGRAELGSRDELFARIFSGGELPSLAAEDAAEPQEKAHLTEVPNEHSN